MIQTIKITIPTFRIAYTEFSKAFTTIFILRLCEINLRGLYVLKSLRILINVSSIPVKLISIILAETIKKSS